jgi:hypothetical protein
MIVEQAMGGPNSTWSTNAIQMPMTTHQHCLYLRMEMTSSEREGVGWENFAGPTLPVGRADYLEGTVQMETFGSTLQLSNLELSSKRRGRKHYARKP